MATEPASPSSPTSPSFLFEEVFGLIVHVKRCRGLNAADRNGKSDPFVELTIGDKSAKTSVQKKTLTPEYNQVFNFVFGALPTDIEITVWDWDLVNKNERIGYKKWSLAQLNEANKFVFDGTLKFDAPSGDKGKHTSWGEIDIRVDSNAIPHVIGRQSDEDSGSVEELLSLVDVEVVGGKNLKSRDIFHKSSAFAVVSFGLQSFRTSIAVGPNPEFHQKCPMWIKKDTEDFILKFSVFDHERLGKPKLVGNSYIRPKDLKVGQEYEFDLPLVSEDAHTDAELAEMMKNLGMSSTPSATECATPTAAMPPKLGSLHLKLKVRPRDQVENEFYATVFKQYDEEKNGTINESELTHMMESFTVDDIKDEIIHAAFVEADKNKKGTIDLEQLKALLRSPRFDGMQLRRKLHSLMIHGEEAVDHVMMKDFLYKPVKKEGKDAKDSKDDGDDESPDNDNTRIFVQDRETGLLVQEEIPSYIKSALKLMYRTGVGREATHSETIRKTMRMITMKQGQKMSTTKSQKNIPDFVKTHKLNTDEIEKPVTEYKTFNEFFYRKLKPSARIPFEPNNGSIATSPADCRSMVFDSLEEGKELWIKGKNFNISNLIGKWDTDGSKAKLFQGGSLMIARLAPQDYHRFHAPVTGTLLKRFMIEGDYNTVNPLAIRRQVDVYTENKRCLCPIQTSEFGLVLMIAVAATMVGSINFSEGFEDISKENIPIKKFQDFGYFAFGGSTTLVLFQPGAIVWDEDLRKNSKNRLETLLKVGNRVGVATGKHQ